MSSDQRGIVEHETHSEVREQQPEHVLPHRIRQLAP
jgi:hypothetical protein